MEKMRRCKRAWSATMSSKGSSVQKKGHYARVCKTKKMSEMNATTVSEDTDDEIPFLGSLSADAEGSPWMLDVNLGNYHTVISKVRSPWSGVHLWW